MILYEHSNEKPTSKRSDTPANTRKISVPPTTISRRGRAALDGAEGADADVHAEDDKPVFAAGFGRVWINALPGWRSPLWRTAR